MAFGRTFAMASLLISPIYAYATLLSVLEGFAPKLNIPNYEQYEIHRALATLSQQWNDAHDAFQSGESQFLSVCRHVLCNPHLVTVGTLSTEALILAWNSNTASTWTTKELSDWLTTFPDLIKHRRLFIDHEVTGAFLPSFLLPEHTHVIKNHLTPEDFLAIESRIMALIFYGPPTGVSLFHVILLPAATISAILFTLCLMLLFYRSSRRAHCKRLELMKQYGDRWSDLQLKISSLEEEMPIISLRPSSSKKRNALNDSSNNRRSSSVSEASRSAAKVMQQLLNMTISTEQAYLLDALERTKDQLDSVKRQVSDRRFRTLFVANRPELSLEVDRCDGSLRKLDSFLSELTQRWNYMREAMDILTTLNDCHWQVESSYRADVSIAVETDPVGQSRLQDESMQFSESPDCSKSAVFETSILNCLPEETSSTPSPTIQDSPEFEEIKDLKCVCPSSVQFFVASSFADENLPTDCTDVPGCDGTETKIPKPSRIPSHTLTPSFHLMNPPASKLVTGLTTPSHIPIGSMKQLTGSSLKPNISRNLPGPIQSLPPPQAVGSRPSTEWQSLRTPGFMSGSKTQPDVDSIDQSS
ncbi:hypothetical protein T265_05834 [Opisthorchis viverrini]|uniref:Uncharacterized protein n=1 Tax=Opisthorchis viverrini TaxID=6198 RepID=A0A074ZMK7_OPIVI|nr:hypothetical protein T265_05834 [Opisthorchis viverrini]KER26997.1 hypothetical protein T265_05834 [Opisthorchis viverrini]